MEKTLIAWTDHTFNPWMGCAKVSDGCKHCYAETLTRNRMGLSLWGVNGRRQVTSAANWQKPRRWNREAEREGVRARVFCASLCDIFEDHPTADETCPRLWELIRACRALDWQLLTKRPERIAQCLPSDWGDGWSHVWLGTSVEDARVIDRIDHLRTVPAVVRFISYEPALGPLATAPGFSLEGIHWVIYGGESGPGWRPEDKQWARDMWQCCRQAGAAFFHKQGAGYRTELGIELDGQIVREWPDGQKRTEAHADRDPQDEGLVAGQDPRR